MLTNMQANSMKTNYQLPDYRVYYSKIQANIGHRLPEVGVS